MATPPGAPQQKKSSSCCGCGCVIVALIVLLIAGAVGAAGYFTYNAVKKASSATPLEMPAANTDPSAVAAVQEKLNSFNTSLQSHQPGTVALSSDELNTLVASNPDFKAKNVQSHVTLKDNSGQLAVSLPCDSVVAGALPGRYLNFQSTFSIQFDNAKKNFIVTPSSIVFAGVDWVTASNNKATTDALIENFNQKLNESMHKDPKTDAILNQLSNVTIKDGQLVLESK